MKMDCSHTRLGAGGHLQDTLLIPPTLTPSHPHTHAALHSGHYTAYSRHPSSGEWWCYNDETATKVGGVLGVWPLRCDRVCNAIL